MVQREASMSKAYNLAKRELGGGLVVGPAIIAGMYDVNRCLRLVVKGGDPFV